MRKALKIVPSRTWLRWYSWANAIPATEMLTRSRNETAPRTKSQNTRYQRTRPTGDSATSIFPAGSDGRKVIHVDCVPLFANHGCYAVDFHQRLTRERRHRYRSSCRTSIGKIGLVDLVHSRIAVNAGQENVQLKNAFHGPAAGFHQGFHIVENLGCVHLDVCGDISFRLARMSPLPGYIDDSVVNNQRGEQRRAVRRLAIIVKLAKALFFSGGIGRSSHQTGRSHPSE